MRVETPHSQEQEADKQAWLMFAMCISGLVEVPSDHPSLEAATINNHYLMFWCRCIIQSHWTEEKLRFWHWLWGYLPTATRSLFHCHLGSCINNESGITDASNRRFWMGSKNSNKAKILLHFPYIKFSIHLSAWARGFSLLDRSQ